MMRRVATKSRRSSYPDSRLRGLDLGKRGAPLAPGQVTVVQRVRMQEGPALEWWTSLTAGARGEAIQQLWDLKEGMEQ